MTLQSGQNNYLTFLNHEIFELRAEQVPNFYFFFFFWSPLHRHYLVMEHNPETSLSIKFSQLFAQDPPTPRQGHVATIFNDYYYVFGGKDLIVVVTFIKK